MKLIINKNVYQNIESYFKEIRENINSIEGIALEVVLTKDGIPIVMPPYASIILNIQIVRIIQNTNLNDITGYDILTLEEALNRLNGINKKIVIIYIPISTTQYAQNIELINKINRQQVINLYNVLAKNPNLNFYVASISHSIIFHLKANNINYKIGVILSPYETNYIDVDFYVFSPEMLSVPILRQQLSIPKEVMVSTHGDEEMMTTYNFFNQFSGIEKNAMLNSISFITDYPLILYRLFN